MIINKDIKKFFESIFCIKNEGIYKVIGIFGIKIKVKSKHKEILKFLTDTKRDIEKIFKQR